MKRYLLAVILLWTVQTMAQPFNVQNASNSLRANPMRYSDLVKAKQSIDLAADHPQTSNDPKMWYYRGKVYYEIMMDSAAKANNLDPDASEKATVSFVNCLKTDTKKNYFDDTKKLVWQSAIGLFNKAVERYSANDATTALRYYSAIFDVFPFDTDNNLKRNNITTEIVYKNMYFAAYKAKDNDKAKTYLQKLIDVKFNDPKIYLYMSRIYQEEKDTAQAISFIEKGRAIFDDNTALMNEMIRLYVLTGKTSILIDKLAESIEAAPDNENLYFTRASLYEGKKDYDKAVADYKKTIELNPDQLYANYNLGVLYFNQAADKANAANNVKNNDEFEKAKKEYEAKFKAAEPYLEKAKDLNTRKSEDDQALYKTTLQTLKQLYARMGENDKYTKLKEELEKK